MNWTTHICPYLLLKIEILDMFETLSWFVVSMWSPLSPSLVVSCAVGFESQGTRRFASILSISTAAVFCQWWPCSITAVRPTQPSHSCPLIRMLGRWFLRLWHLSHGLEFQSFKLKLDARYEQTIQNIEHIWTYCVHRAECAWIISHVSQLRPATCHSQECHTAMVVVAEHGISKGTEMLGWTTRASYPRDSHGFPMKTSILWRILHDYSILTCFNRW